MSKLLVGTAALAASLAPAAAVPEKLDLQQYRTCDATLSRIPEREAALQNALDRIPGAYALHESRPGGILRFTGLDSVLLPPESGPLLDAEADVRGNAKLLLRDLQLLRESGCAGVVAEGTTPYEQELQALRNWGHAGSHSEDSKKLYEQAKAYTMGETLTASPAALADINAAVKGLFGGSTATQIEIVGMAPHRFLRAGHVIALETGTRGDFQRFH